jgi:hypothetical protein
VLNQKNLFNIFRPPTYKYARQGTEEGETRMKKKKRRRKKEGYW